MSKFSDLELKKLWKEGRPRKHHDGDGLYFKVSGPEAASWYFRYRTALVGKPVEMGLGRYPRLGAGDARKQRTEAAAMLARGQDPREHRNEVRSKKVAVSDLRKTLKQLVHALVQSQEGEWSAEYATRVLRRAEMYAFLPDPVVGNLGNLAPADANGVIALTILQPRWHTYHGT